MAKDSPDKPGAKGWFSGGLSKEDKKYLTDLGAKIQHQESMIATLADRVGRLERTIQDSKPLKIEVTCKCSGGNEGGLTAAQEAEQAAKLDAASGPLKVAVDANQP